MSSSVENFFFIVSKTSFRIINYLYCLFSITEQKKSPYRRTPKYRGQVFGKFDHGP